MTKENKPSPGARQYALGMGLLIAPKAMSELYVPELFDGTNDVQEQAMAVITESSRLAGELGAGITLVTEILPNKIRGYGTTLVSKVVVFGALLAYVL